MEAAPSFVSAASPAGATPHAVLTPNFTVALTPLPCCPLLPPSPPLPQALKDDKGAVDLKALESLVHEGVRLQVDMPQVKAIKERVEAAKTLSTNIKATLALKGDQKVAVVSLKALLTAAVQQRVMLPEQPELQVRQGCWGAVLCCAVQHACAYTCHGHAAACCCAGVCVGECEATAVLARTAYCSDLMHQITRH